MRFGRLLGRISSPKAVGVLLLIVLAVNGFLLYRQYAGTPAAAPPESTRSREVSSTPGTPDGSRETDAAPERGPGTPADGPSSTVSADEPAVPNRSAAVELGGLGEAVQRCDGEKEESCVRDYVLQAAPEARYIGGREDLPVSGAGHGREVLYFEAPALGLCESVREEYEAEGGPTYTVIVVGQGSFESGRGATCIPEA